jgi:peptidoglycan/LPS O-acetylase OafA/YrhL
MGLAVLSIWVVERGSLPKWLQPIDRFPILPWLVSLAAFLVVSKGIGLPGGVHAYSNGQWLAQNTLYQVLALCVLLPAVFGDQTKGLVRKILANKALLYTGAISYGIYLIHLPLLDKAWRLLDQSNLWTKQWFWDLAQNNNLYFLVWTVLAVIVTMILATILYYTVERPVLRLKRLIPDWNQLRAQSRGKLASKAKTEPKAAKPMARA